MPRRSQDRRQTPVAPNTSALWGAFAIVMLLLVALAVVPWLASARLQRAGAPLAEVIDPARVVIRQLEAALSSELYLSATPGWNTDTALSVRYASASANEARSSATLKALLRNVGAPADSDLKAALAAANAWHAQQLTASTHEERSAGGTLVTAVPLLRRDSLGLVALDAAERLDNDLDDLADRTRSEIAGIERLNVLVTGGLVPLTALGVVLLGWAAIRTARLAELAEERRRALAVASESRETLLRSVSHDLRNPLGVIASFLELLQEGHFGELNDSQADAVSRAQRQTKQALRTTTDFLDLARSYAGTLASRRETVHLETLVNELARDHAASAEMAGITLESSPEPKPGVVNTELIASTDPDRVRQVVTNLLSNAIKYTPQGGRVTVRVQRNDHGPPFVRDALLAIEVSDTGPGIPPQDRERIFEESVRLSGAKKVAHGAGIGLASARRMARALDGDLTVGPSQDGGSTFTLWLPPKTTDAG